MRPPRHASRPYARRRLLLALATLVVALTTVTGNGAAQGITQRGFPPGWQTAASTPQVPLSCRLRSYPLPNEPLKCVMTKHYPGAPTIVLWGDSHAWQQAPAIEAAIGKRHINLVAFMLGSCPLMKLPSVRDRGHYGTECPQLGALALNYITKAVHEHRDIRVVVAMGWELYRNATTPYAQRAHWKSYFSTYLRSTSRLGAKGTPAAFSELGRLHVPTDVVGPMPMVPTNAPPCSRGEQPYQCYLPRRAALVSESDNDRHIHHLMSRLTRPGRLIQPADYLCSKTRCHSRLFGVPMYWDSQHISAVVTSQLGATYFAPTVRDLLAEHRRHTAGR